MIFRVRCAKRGAARHIHATQTAPAARRAFDTFDLRINATRRDTTRWDHDSAGLHGSGRVNGAELRGERHLARPPALGITDPANSRFCDEGSFA